LHFSLLVIVGRRPNTVFPGTLFNAGNRQHTEAESAYATGKTLQRICNNASATMQMA
jgi:hypothetical protein